MNVQIWHRLIPNGSCAYQPEVQTRARFADAFNICKHFPRPSFQSGRAALGGSLGNIPEEISRKFPLQRFRHRDILPRLSEFLRETEFRLLPKIAWARAPQ